MLEPTLVDKIIFNEMCCRLMVLRVKDLTLLLETSFLLLTWYALHDIVVTSTLLEKMFVHLTAQICKRFNGEWICPRVKMCLWALNKFMLLDNKKTWIKLKEELMQLPVTNLESKSRSKQAD